VDGILSGVVSTNQDIYIVDFAVHDLPGRELFRRQYRHVIDSTIRGIILSANDEPVLASAFQDSIVSRSKNASIVGHRNTRMRREMGEGRNDYSVRAYHAAGQTRRYLCRPNIRPGAEPERDKVKSWRLEPAKDSHGSTS